LIYSSFSHQAILSRELGKAGDVDDQANTIEGGAHGFNKVPSAGNTIVHGIAKQGGNKALYHYCDMYLPYATKEPLLERIVQMAEKEVTKQRHAMIP
jgi:hypothetical protein